MFRPIEFPDFSSNADDLNSLAGPIGLDLEWNVETGIPTMAGFADENRLVLLPWEVAAEPLARMTAAQAKFIGHNFIQADRVVLRGVGIDVPPENIEDTIIRHWLANSHLCKTTAKVGDDTGGKKGHGYMNLWAMLSLYTGLPYYKTCRDGATREKYKSPVFCQGFPCPIHNEPWYCAVDAWGPVLALPGLKRDMALRGVEKLYSMHVKLASILAKIRDRGILVDIPYVQGLRARFLKDKEEAASRLPFNPESPKQVMAWFKERGIRLKKASDEDENAQKETVREALRDFFKKKKLDFDDLWENDKETDIMASVAGTPYLTLYQLFFYKEMGDGPDRWYGERFLRGGQVLHPHFGFYTSSGRLQCADPNMQNVPKRGYDPITGEKFETIIRSAVIPRDGYDWYKADYANGEGNVMLHLAGYKRPEGVDFHLWTASQIGLKDGDRFTLAFGGSAREAAKSGTHACLTGDHEVLTSKGWIKIENWKGQPIAQWSTQGQISFVKPRFVSFYFDGNLVTLRGRGLSTDCTPEHFFPVQTSGSWRSRRYHSWHRQKVNEIFSSGRIPVCGTLEDCVETITDAEVRQAVAIQADGSLLSPKIARFHLVRKRKRERLKLLFGEKAKARPCVDHKDGESFTVSFGENPLLSGKKSFNENLLLLSSRQREIFLDEVLFWDGSTKGCRKEYDNTDYASVVWVQTIAHLSGRQSLVRELRHRFGKRRIWSASFNKRKFSSVDRLKKGTRRFKGKVYCFTVPSSFFLVRFQDRIHVTGNSNYLEGVSLKTKEELKSRYVQNEISAGARLVYPDWTFEDKIVTFTGINFAERAYGSATWENRKKALDFQRAYFAAYPKLRDLQKRITKQVEEHKAVQPPNGYYLISYGPEEERMKTACAVWGCLEPSAKVLTSDLRWIQNGDVKQGQELIGIEENLTRGSHSHRRLVGSFVESVGPVFLPSCRIITDKGEVVASMDHRWLTKRGKGRGPSLFWMETCCLLPGDEIAYLESPWKESRTYEAGYLAAGMDGEGTISEGQISFYQSKNEMLEAMVSHGKTEGFSLSLNKGRKRHPKYKMNYMLSVDGGLPANLRFAGSIRPKRLNTRKLWEGITPFARYKQVATVIKIEPLGLRELVGMTTSSKTFIGEGMLSHNSQPVAHFTKLAMIRAEEDGRLDLNLQVHDELDFDGNKSLEPKKVAGLIRDYMTFEVEELPGLMIPADVKRGKSWGGAKEKL